MRYVIDTHIFLWLVFSPEKINGAKLKILEDPSNPVYISSISFWEISLKFSLGKLELQGSNPDDLPDQALQMGIKILDIDSINMATYHQLRQMDKHKDPFDRLMIWYCIKNKYVLVSCDNKFSDYEVLGLKLL